MSVSVHVDALLSTLFGCIAKYDGQVGSNCDGVNNCR